jgi:hypothetical protein
MSSNHFQRLWPYALTALLAACAGPIISNAEVFKGFEITDRGVLPFGVPFVRSGEEYGPNQPTGFDVGPRGSPPDKKNSGLAWIDVCNADLLTDPGAPVTCIYAGAWKKEMQLGSRSFNGAPVVPLKLRIGDTIVGELNEKGLVIYGTVQAKAFVEK